MKYYRNVEVPPDPTENRKEEDEFDEMHEYIRGGIELPPLADVPGIDTDEGYDEAEETLDDLSLEEEEVYDDSVGPDIEIEDDDF